jgi:parallel beta-helix repeat protein
VGLTELFVADRAQTTVTSGGTDAPVAGTVETWTVASSAMFGAAVTGVSQFHVADPVAPSEIITVTAVSGTTWTVTRGSNGVTVTHQAGFAVYQAATAAFLAGVAPVFSPPAYGAKCDGITDDTAAVAATYAAAAGNGTVLFPPGTVTCIQGGINPAGAATWGLGATVRFLAGITPVYAMFTPSAACSFWGLTFDLNSANTTNPGSNVLYSPAVYAFNASGWPGQVRLTQCTIINGWRCGLVFRGGSNNNPLLLASTPYLVDSCVITGNDYIGIYSNFAADGAVVNSYIHSNGAAGIDESGGLRNRFAGNTVASSGTHGIVSQYSYGALITGNDCTDNGVSGIVIGGGSTTISAATHFTITGNACRNNGHSTPGHGIDLDTSITGEGNTPVPAYGTVTGNTCDANVDHGIYVNNSQYVTVTGNVATGNGIDGILLAAQNCTLTGNITTGNANGVAIEGTGGGHQVGVNYSSGNSDSNFIDTASIASTYAAEGASTPGGTTSYLRADGSWSSPAASTAGNLLAVNQYAPATLTHYTSSSTTLAAMSAANMTVSFTAPADGNVLIRLTANAASPSSAVTTFWGLLDHTTGNLYGVAQGVTGVTAPCMWTCVQLITGLTPGNVYQMDWALASSTASSTVNTYAFGGTSKTVTSSVGAAVMEVYAA